MIHDFSITPVILCGGDGSRLWPLSNPNKPKQFISLPGMNYTLLQNTLIRLKKSKYFNPPIIITQEIFVSYVEEQARECEVDIGHIIMEPKSNGTAFAAALAAFYIKQNTTANNELILIMPIDHYLEDATSLFDAINNNARQSIDCITLFGVAPQRKEKDYGYIQVANEGSENLEKVIKFTEKPNEAEMGLLLDDPLSYWNSGIFFTGVDCLLKEIKKFVPQIYDTAKEAMSKSAEVNKKVYTLTAELEAKESLDKAVIEKSDNVFMCTVNIKWHDIGYLYSAWEVSEKDVYGNFTSGNTFLMDTQNSYIVSDQKPTAVIGLNDVVVVNTDDAILVTDKSNSSKIKSMYYNYNFGIKPKKNKPWGNYYELERNKSFVVKKLKILPLQRTSLQFHKNRSEYLIVVEGSAAVIVGHESYILNPGDGAFIPCNAAHRITNNGVDNLVLIEVQIGNLISENDIVRIQDDYGRAAH